MKAYIVFTGKCRLFVSCMFPICPQRFPLHLCRPRPAGLPWPERLGFFTFRSCSPTPLSRSSATSSPAPRPTEFQVDPATTTSVSLVSRGNGIRLAHRHAFVLSVFLSLCLSVCPFKELQPASIQRCRTHTPDLQTTRCHVDLVLVCLPFPLIKKKAT